MSSVTYDNRTAVVTGGSRGIGRESARRLGADGCNVVVVYSGNAGEAEKAVREVHDAGGSAVHVRPTCPSRRR
jgi:3-oxoacyl-[acyl-carrier protein] reductase